MIQQVGTQSEAKSLFDRCSALRRRLLQVRGFSNYFQVDPHSNTDLESTLELTDPVSHLWDIFSTGVPLCYLFNQLPQEAGFGRIVDHRFDWESAQNDDERVRVRAIAHFSMMIRGYKIQQQIRGIQLFTMTDLWDRSSTKGFSKVIETAIAIVDCLPPSAFVQYQGSGLDSNALGLPDPKRIHRRSFLENIINELIQTERNYVKRLSDTLTFSEALSTGDRIDPNLLFVGINELVASQNKFLSLLEETATSEFDDQRWGRCFLECEEEFTEAYLPFCANYPSANKRLESMPDTYQLLISGHSFSKSDLNMMLISPVSRVCKYQLLLESLLKAYVSSTYPHFAELERGLEAAKRLTDKINEAIQRSENEQTALDLASRVCDWRGFVPTASNFGKLLLHNESLTITSSDIDQDYSADDDFCVVSWSDVCQTFHVFLFEHIVILCQEETDNSLRNRKFPRKIGSRNGALILQGHILLEDIIRAVPADTSSARHSKRSSRLSQPEYPLTIWWRGDDKQEASFTLRFNFEDQMHQWQARINTILQGLFGNRTPSGSFNIQRDDKASEQSEQPTGSIIGRLYSHIPRSAHDIKPPPLLKSRFSFRNSSIVRPFLTATTINSTAEKSSSRISDHNSSKISLDSCRSERKERTTNASPAKVEIKVIFRDDVFLLHLPLTTTYEHLVAKVLSSSRIPLDSATSDESENQIHGQSLLRMRYIDEDGDAVSLKSSEDAQMFLEQYHLQRYHPKRPVVLLVSV